MLRLFKFQLKLLCTLALLWAFGCGISPYDGRKHGGNSDNGESAIFEGISKTNLPPNETPSAPLGWTPGTFSVEANGSAAYTIPIQTPPGRVDISPNLSISYDSQAGDGLLGIGWSISGLSTIRRVGRDLRYDDVIHPVRFNENDAFEIDGSRMVSVSDGIGLSYRTKIDQFEKIIPHGDGPDYFTVYTKDGLTLTYGDKSTTTPSNSAVFTAFDENSLIWALSEVRDRSGNYMSIRYKNIRTVEPATNAEVSDGVWVTRPTAPSFNDPTIEMVPSLISYTGNNITGRNPKRWVSFSYSSRDDQSSGYFAGIETQSTKRLETIRTGVAQTGTLGIDGLDREYDFCYSDESGCSEDTETPSRSMLVSVTEKDKLGVEKKNTTFNWTKDALEFVNEIVPSDGYTFRPYVRIDIDNDGFQDYIYSNRLGGDCNVYALLNTSEMSNKDRLTGHASDTLLGSCSEYYGSVTIDYNNDGFVDLLKTRTDDNWQIILNTGTGSPPFFKPARDTPLIGRTKDVFFQDLNGDGLFDYIRRHEPGPYTGDTPPSPMLYYYYRFHTGNGFGEEETWGADDMDWYPDRTVVPVFLDYNGDGATDLLVGEWHGWGATNPTNYTAVSFVNNSILFSDTNLPLFDTENLENVNKDSDFEIITLDVNGDKLMDILKLNKEDACIVNGSLWLNTGNKTPFFVGGESGLTAFGSIFDFGVCYSLQGISDFTHDQQEDLLMLASRGSNRDYSSQWMVFPASSTIDYSSEKFTSVEIISELRNELLSSPDRPHAIIVDLNGDYLPDLVTQERGREYTAHINKTGLPLITHIRDGRIIDDHLDGWSVIIEYKSTSDETVCSTTAHEEATRSAPLISRMYKRKPSAQVVASYSLDNGQGNPRLSYRFRYHDPRTDQYWGWLGYGEVEQFQEHSKNKIVSMYANHYYAEAGVLPIRYYPFNGLVRHQVNDTTMSAGDRYVTSQTNLYRVKEVNDGETVFPHLLTSSEDVVWHAPSGIRTLLSKNHWQIQNRAPGEYAIDDFGNVEKYVKTLGHSTGGSYRVEIETAYHNNPSNWLIGLPHTIRTLFQPPSAASTTHEAKYEYWPGTRLFKRYIREPNNPQYNQVSSLTYYDDGNLESSTIQGVSGQTLEERSLFTLFYDPEEHIFVSEVQNGLSQTTRFQHNAIGQVIMEEDQNGLQTHHYYDGFGRLSKTEDMQTDLASTYNLDTVLINNQNHLRVTTQRTDWSEKVTIFDRLHRPMLSGKIDLNGSYPYMRYTYNHLGKIHRMYAPQYIALDETGSHYYEYLYDNLGRAIEVIGSDNSLKTVTFAGKQVTITQKAQRENAENEALYSTTFYRFNEMGQVEEVEDAQGKIWQYNYGKLGLLDRIVDPNEKNYGFEYDDYARLDSVNDPSGGQSSSVYDTFDQLFRTVDAKGCEITYYYDILGRTTSIESLGENCCGVAGCVERMDYEYDDPMIRAIGKLFRTSSTPWDHSTLYTYNENGQLEQKTRTILGEDFTHQYQYDNFGRLQSHQYPEFEYTSYAEYGGELRLPYRIEVPFEVYFNYDAYGHLQFIRNYNSLSMLEPESPVDYLTVSETNAAGQTTKVKYGNNIETRYDYHPLTGKLISVESPVQNLYYGYNPDGKMQFREDKKQGRRESYTYDSLGRLATNTLFDVDLSGATNECHFASYQYDELGNMTYHSGVGRYIYDSSSEHPYWLRSLENLYGGVEFFEHDDNGNIETLSDIDISYTSFYKPKTFSNHSNAEVFELEYDGETNRVIKHSPASITLYADDYLRISGARETMHKYNIGNAIIDRQATENGYREILRYIHFDHLGSPHVLTGEDEHDVQAQMYFDVFGTSRANPWNGEEGIIDDTGITRGFNGHEQDKDIQQSLINMGGREYDSRMGRFLSPDPVVQFRYNGQSFNAYSYGLNDPLMNIDPSGYQTVGLSSPIFGNGGGFAGGTDSFYTYGECFENGGFGNQDSYSEDDDASWNGNNDAEWYSDLVGGSGSGSDSSDNSNSTPSAAVRSIRPLNSLGRAMGTRRPSVNGRLPGYSGVIRDAASAGRAVTALGPVASAVAGVVQRVGTSGPRAILPPLALNRAAQIGRRLELPRLMNWAIEQRVEQLLQNTERTIERPGSLRRASLRANSSASRIRLVGEGMGALSAGATAYNQYGSSSCVTTTCRSYDSVIAGSTDLVVGASMPIAYGIDAATGLASDKYGAPISTTLNAAQHATPALVEDLVRWDDDAQMDWRARSRSGEFGYPMMFWTYLGDLVYGRDQYFSYGGYHEAEDMFNRARERARGN